MEELEAVRKSTYRGLLVLFRPRLLDARRGEAKEGTASVATRPRSDVSSMSRAGGTPMDFRVGWKKVLGSKNDSMKGDMLHFHHSKTSKPVSEFWKELLKSLPKVVRDACGELDLFSKHDAPESIWE